MKNFVRYNFFIKKGFQLKYTFIVLSVLIGIVLVSGTGLYIGMWTSITENLSSFRVAEDLESATRIADYERARYKQGDYRLKKLSRQAELLSQQQRDVLEEALRAVNRSLLPKIALLSFVILIGGIFISHKIAGPMYRFERSAEAVREGDLTVNFNVRKDDALMNTASSLEKMVEGLRADFIALKSSAEKLKSSVSDGSEGTAEYVKELSRILEKYKI